MKGILHDFNNNDHTLTNEDYSKIGGISRNELNKLIQKTKSTVLIVAQRISTIKNADKIIVLDEGKIVGMGKHDELLSNCEIYKQIAYSQLSKEELA